MKQINAWIIYILTIIFMIFVLKYLKEFNKEKYKEKQKNNIEEYVDKEKSGQIIEVKITKTNEIIAMDVNDYLRGVVPAEMPPTFEIEALKAQAIVARTYLYNKIAQNGHTDADICDNFNHCQAFYTEDKLEEIWRNKGYSDKTIEEYKERVNIAVNETTDIVAKYNGECIKAFFHANSGGVTESSKEIWGGEDIPYLVSVESLGEESHPYYKTKVIIKKTEFNKIILDNINYNVDNKELQVSDYTISGRVKNLKIGDQVIKATTLRSLIGLKSTCFNIENTKDEYIFNVKGYGHGLGMSQTGANYYAKIGKKAEEIIKHYYTGVKVEKI